MTENKRFVAIDDGEVYYIADTNNLKSLDDFIMEFSKAEYEYTDDEAVSVAKEEYWQMIYENSLSAKENVDKLNKLSEENEQLKKDVEYWKQVASQYNNELNVKEHFRLNGWKND